MEIRTRMSGYQSPPLELRTRVAGSADEAWFLESGARSVREFNAAATAAQIDLSPPLNLLDFGCGCGRVLRHLVQRFPHYTFFGADTDEETIAWLRDNPPPGARLDVMKLGELPPLPLGSSSIDLVYCHSVFTHLPESVGFAWLEELGRVVKPGGWMSVSFHGRHALSSYLSSVADANLAGHYADALSGIANHGFYFTEGRNANERRLVPYYGQAFHSIEYISTRFTRVFDVVAWLPSSALGLQDVVVLRRKT